jgi:hypothetical protein
LEEEGFTSLAPTDEALLCTVVVEDPLDPCGRRGIMAFKEAMNDID